MPISLHAHHQRVFKLLQPQRPLHLWLLKAPPHLFKLETFAVHYPSAKFVWCHRDPASVISSVSSLQYTLYSARCVAGAHEKMGEHRFVDVWNGDVVARPVKTLPAFYENLDFTPTRQFKASVEDYSRRNARGAFAAHSSIRQRNLV